MVIVPFVTGMTWLTATTATPLIVTAAGPSGALKVIVPAVVSELEAESEPADSPKRAGRPASLTTVPAAPATGTVTVTGRSALLIVRVAVDTSPSPSVRR